MMIDILNKLIKDNNGYVSTAHAVEANVSKVDFLKFLKNQKLLKVAHGLYMSESVWQDDFYIIQYRYPKLIFSHESSAYLWGLSNREPFHHTVTMRSGSGSSRLTKEEVKVYKVKEDLLNIGMVRIVTPFGNEVQTYNLERTFCDYVRNKKNIEIQEFQSYIQEYFRCKDKNLNQLIQYSRLFKIEDKVRTYIEMFI